MFTKDRGSFAITSFDDVITILNRISRIKIFLIFLATIWILSSAISGFLYIINSEGYAEAMSNTTDLVDSYPFLGAVLLFVIVGPFLETIIFQIFLLKAIKTLLEKLGVNSWTPSLVLSSLIFTAYHGLGSESIYHGIIIVSPILPGAFIFCLLAILEYEREKGHPITCVFFLHAILNFVQLARYFFFD